MYFQESVSGHEREKRSLQWEDFLNDVKTTVEKDILPQVSNHRNLGKTIESITNQIVGASQELIKFFNENPGLLQQLEQLDKPKLEMLSEILANKELIAAFKNNEEILNFLSNEENLHAVLKVSKNKELIRLITNHTDVILENVPLFKKFIEDEKLLSLINKNVNLITELIQNEDNLDLISKLLENEDFVKTIRTLLKNEEVMTTLKQKPALIEFFSNHSEAIAMIAGNPKLTRLIEDNNLLEKLKNQPDLISLIIDKFDNLALISNNSHHLGTIETILSNQELIDQLKKEPELIDLMANNFKTVFSFLKNKDLTKYIKNNSDDVKNILGIAMERKDEIRPLLHCDKRARGLASYLTGIGLFVCKEGRVECFENFLRHILAKRGFNIPYMQV